MSAEIRVELVDVEVVHRWFEEICGLYDEVFSAPPFYWRSDESELHRARLTRLLDDPSFGAALAFQDSVLIGFAYGFALKPDTSWWSGLTPEVPAADAVEWSGRTFVLFDYGVRHDCRNRGVGRALHNLLLGSRAETRATLATQPAAVETQELYRRWGWHAVGTVEGGPQAAAPRFDIYRRDLLDDLRT
jgi:GNAT superfamily N-acetyltransferase